MSPISLFLIRAALALACGLILSAFFFGGIRLYTVAILAVFMLGVAYVLEALRKSRGR